MQHPSIAEDLFTNRERELARLRLLIDQTKRGDVQRLALLGLRRTGKTTLLRRFLSSILHDPLLIPCYMDLSYLVSSPERFCIGYLTAVAQGYLRDRRVEVRRLSGLDSLYEAAMGSESRTLVEAVRTVRTELSKDVPDRQVILGQTFALPEELARESGRWTILALDEFQEIMALENFPGLERLLWFLRDQMQSHKRVSYIVAGSAVSYMSHLLSNSGSPLFGSFERMGLSFFDEEDSRKLLQKIVPAATDPVVGRVVHRLTVGHPHYLTAVGRRLESMYYASGRALDSSTAKEAFLREALSPEGRIYEFCRYLYDFSLQKARAYAVLKSVLAILAEEGRLGISALARRLKVSISTARDYLRWLADVDLVGDEAGEYFLLDPVLRFWIGQVVRGATMPIPSGELIATTELLEELEEAFLRVSSELGTAKESQLRELMRLFANHKVDGGLFGTSDQIRLPHFKEITSYCSPDGQIEIDVMGLDEEVWLAEVKWRRSAVQRKELVSFFQKASQVATSQQWRQPRLWYVSKAGFTRGALSFATEVGMLVTNETGLRELEKRLRSKSPSPN